MEDLASSRDGTPHEQAVQAIQAVGTNALPLIEAMLFPPRHDNPIFSKNWRDAFQAVKRSILQQPNEDEMVARAQLALECLGPQADAMVLQITKHLTNSSRLNTASKALHNIGSESAMRELAAAATNPMITVRWAAAAGLDYRKPTNLTHAAFVTCLNDTNWHVRQRAVWSLAEAQQHKAAVIDLLLAALNDSRTEVRVSAVAALGNFETEATHTIPILQKLESDAEPLMAKAATDTLIRIRRNPQLHPNTSELR